MQWLSQRGCYNTNTGTSFICCLWGHKVAYFICRHLAQASPLPPCVQAMMGMRFAASGAMAPLLLAPRWALSGRHGAPRVAL